MAEHSDHEKAERLDDLMVDRMADLLADWWVSDSVVLKEYKMAVL